MVPVKLIAGTWSCFMYFLLTILLCSFCLFFHLSNTSDITDTANWILKKICILSFLVLQICFCVNLAVIRCSELVLGGAEMTPVICRTNASKHARLLRPAPDILICI